MNQTSDTAIKKDIESVAWVGFCSSAMSEMMYEMPRQTKFLESFGLGLCPGGSHAQNC